MGNKQDAINYYNIISKKINDARILEFEVSYKDFNNMKKLDMTKMTDDEANMFLAMYARLNNGIPNHGYDYIKRGTGIGVEHYFSKIVFDKLKFKK